MATTLKGRMIAFLAAPEGTEQVELVEPWNALTEAGGTPRLVSLGPGEIQMFNHLDRGDRWPVDLTVREAQVEDFDMLVLPGGVANPDRLRTDARAVRFVREFFDTGRAVAVICHGPWTLIEADVLRGRTLTSWPSLRTDIRNAGGNWVDQEVVVDADGPNELISSRKPQDLPAFCATVVREFSKAPMPG